MQPQPIKVISNSLRIISAIKEISKLLKNSTWKEVAELIGERPLEFFGDKKYTQARDIFYAMLYHEEGINELATNGGWEKILEKLKHSAGRKEMRGKYKSSHAANMRISFQKAAGFQYVDAALLLAQRLKSQPAKLEEINAQYRLKETVQKAIAKRMALEQIVATGNLGHCVILDSDGEFDEIFGVALAYEYSLGNDTLQLVSKSASRSIVEFFQAEHIKKHLTQRRVAIVVWHKTLQMIHRIIKEFPKKKFIFHFDDLEEVAFEIARVELPKGYVMVSIHNIFRVKICNIGSLFRNRRIFSLHFLSREDIKYRKIERIVTEFDEEISLSSYEDLAKNPMLQDLLKIDCSGIEYDSANLLKLQKYREVQTAAVNQLQVVIANSDINKAFSPVPANSSTVKRKFPADTVTASSAAASEKEKETNQSGSNNFFTAANEPNHCAPEKKKRR